jgi:flavodoxin
MKKIQIALVLLFISNLSFSQTDFKFYKSVDDYTNNNFVPNYEIIANSFQYIIFAGESLKVKTNGSSEERVSIADFCADFYSPNANQLWRRFKNKSYIILEYGEFCFYVTPGWSADPEYYSETISGPVKKFKSSVLTKKLKEKGLLEAYKNDKPKREFKDNVNDYFNKLLNRNVKYVKLLNEAK